MQQTVAQVERTCKEIRVCLSSMQLLLGKQPEVSAPTEDTLAEHPNEGNNIPPTDELAQPSETNIEKQNKEVQPYSDCIRDTDTTIVLGAGYNDDNVQPHVNDLLPTTNIGEAPRSPTSFP